MRIGTPPQLFEIFPGTNGNQIWIPVPEGCLVTDPLNCGSLRGVLPYQGLPSNGFQKNESSTWTPEGIYSLDIENGLNLTGNGDFGYDCVGLGVQNSGGATLTHQLLAGIATKDFYLGELGLSIKPANLSSFDDPIPSCLQNLRKQGSIPSLSYGYTAGAKYQLDGVLGSLTLGGFDSSRFEPSNFSLAFNADDSRHLTVAVQSLLVSNTPNGTVMPITQGEYFLIDSSVADIWLPLAACQALEETLGLKYDDSTDLYTVNSSTHERLQNLNPTITFKLGASKFGGQYLAVILPYAAFDLQASSPIYPNATNYFPIRRAMNNTQYILGRTFLQEVYIIVDHERSNFTIAKAKFDQGSAAGLIAINSMNMNQVDDSPIASQSSTRISSGVVAGIAVGATLLLVFLIGLLVLKYVRKRRPHREPDTRHFEVDVVDEYTAKRWTLGELGGQAVTGAELDERTSPRYQLEAQTNVFELGPSHWNGSPKTDDNNEPANSSEITILAEKRTTLKKSSNEPYPYAQTHYHVDEVNLPTPVSGLSPSSDGETFKSLPRHTYASL